MKLEAELGVNPYPEFRGYRRSGSAGVSELFLAAPVFPSRFTLGKLPPDLAFAQVNPLKVRPLFLYMNAEQIAVPCDEHLFQLIGRHFALECFGSS